MITKTLVIVEGATTGTVLITSNVPPLFLCDTSVNPGTVDEVQLEIEYEVADEEFSCRRESDLITQAVFKRTDSSRFTWR